MYQKKLILQALAEVSVRNLSCSSTAGRGTVKKRNERKKKWKNISKPWHCLLGSLCGKEKQRKLRCMSKKNLPSPMLPFLWNPKICRTFSKGRKKTLGGCVKGSCHPWPVHGTQTVGMYGIYGRYGFLESQRARPHPYRSIRRWIKSLLTCVRLETNWPNMWPRSDRQHSPRCHR